MTYFRFHLIFNLPILLCLILGLYFFGSWGLEQWCVLGVVLGIVMIFTTPWDNYAAYCGIWGFADNRYWKMVKYLPVEEYLFFVIQSVQAMLLTQIFIDTNAKESLEVSWGLDRWILMGMLSLVFLVIGLFGKKRIDSKSRWHYAWHLFYWFLPVIFMQWIIGWEVLLPRWEWVVFPALLLGTYLSLADYLAINEGIWHFDYKQVTGVMIGKKMPWEEAAFFYLTSFLVAQSYLILLPEALR
ncbi:MAG: lycopene cyclase domain-containing protein [Verrucomicrobiota bacterium]